jgi:hypothetical protein
MDAYLSAVWLPLTALFICQIVFLSVRELHSPTLQNAVSLPADIQELLAIAAARVLSYIHHYRARVNSMAYLRSQQGSYPVYCWICGYPTMRSLRVNGEDVSLVPARETEKVVPATPEPFSGLWMRARFAWLSGTFRRGYVRVLSVDALP